VGRHGWAYQFYILAGLGAISAGLGFLVVPEERCNNDKGGNRGMRVDWIGSVVSTMALSLMIFSVTQSGLVKGGWRNACK